MRSSLWFCWRLFKSCMGTFMFRECDTSLPSCYEAIINAVVRYCVHKVCFFRRDAFTSDMNTSQERSCFLRDTVHTYLNPARRNRSLSMWENVTYTTPPSCRIHAWGEQHSGEFSRGCLFGRQKGILFGCLFGRQIQGKGFFCGCLFGRQMQDKNPLLSTCFHAEHDANISHF